MASSLTHQKNILLPLQETDGWYRDQTFTVSLVGHLTFLWQRRFISSQKLESLNATLVSRNTANWSSSLNSVNLQNCVYSRKKELHIHTMHHSDCGKEWSSFLSTPGGMHHLSESLCSKSSLFPSLWFPGMVTRSVLATHAHFCELLFSTPSSNHAWRPPSPDETPVRFL